MSQMWENVRAGLGWSLRDMRTRHFASHRESCQPGRCIHWSKSLLPTSFGVCNCFLSFRGCWKMSELGWDGHSVICGNSDFMHKLDILPVTGKLNLETVFVDPNHFCQNHLAYLIVSFRFLDVEKYASQAGMVTSWDVVTLTLCANLTFRQSPGNSTWRLYSLIQNHFCQHHLACVIIFFRFWDVKKMSKIGCNGHSVTMWLPRLHMMRKFSLNGSHEN